MTDLVQIQNKQVVTTSLKVAEVFEKQHKHVLESIEKIISAEKSAQSLFAVDTYKDKSGKTNKMYYMNRDGLSLLVMGFNGKKALSWKMEYIKAFNQMEKALKLPQISPNPHYRTRMIKTAVKDIGDTAGTISEVFGVKKPMAMASAMQLVGVAYGIDTSPLEQFLPSESTPCYMNPTDIANVMCIKKGNGSPAPQQVNIMLAELGLQEKKGKQWTLTEKGKKYGEVKPFVNNGHSGYQIQWHDSVIKLLKGESA